MAEQVRIINHGRSHFTINQVTIRAKASVVMMMDMNQDTVDALAAQQVEVFLPTGGKNVHWRPRTLAERHTVKDTRVVKTEAKPAVAKVQAATAPKAEPANPANDPIVVTPAVVDLSVNVAKAIEDATASDVTDAAEAELMADITAPSAEPAVDDRAAELRAMHFNTVKKIARKLGVDDTLKGDALIAAIIAAEQAQ